MIEFLIHYNMKKSKTRIFVEKTLSANLMVYIKDKQHHFLKNVIRLKINDNLLTFDDKTGEWLCRVMSVNRDNTVIQILEKTRDFKKEPDIWLIFAPIKQYRLNITIQKATELGVSKLIPCITDYTNNTNLNYKNLSLNIIEAAEQSERLSLPTIEKKVTLDDLIYNYPKDRCIIFCDERKLSNISMFDAIKSKKNFFSKWSILIGPEGGFSESETEKIKKMNNCLPVSLGRRVLRSDTATIASLFCLQSLIDID